MLARLMVGVVTSTHGLKGEVNIFPTTDDVGRYDYLERVLLGDFDDAEELEIENVNYIKLLEFCSKEKLEALANKPYKEAHHPTKVMSSSLLFIPS